MARLYRLDKAVLSIKNNAEKFLNGITANTLDRPQNAFLDVHGKIIATFDQIKIGDDFLIAIERPFYEPLMQHLDKFICLSKAIVQKEDYNVYFDLDGSYQPQGDEFVVAQKKGQLIVTRRNFENNVSTEEFSLFRLKANIPIHGVDYRDELLLNVDEEQFVSYTKGCFLGQEPISKVHNRSKPTWKLVVKSEDEVDEAQKQSLTSKTKDPQTGKILGFIFISNR